jgi:hypothetical protein
VELRTLSIQKVIGYLQAAAPDNDVIYNPVLGNQIAKTRMHIPEDRDVALAMVTKIREVFEAYTPET